MTKMGECTILANPGHGNGPTVALLMAAEAIQEKSGRPVNLIFPDLEDGRQRVVLQNRRDARRHVRIFFDAQLGKLLQRVTLRDHNFHQNVSDIVAHQERAQAEAQAYIQSGLRTVREFAPPGLKAQAARAFQPSDLTMELNHGSRLRFLNEHAFSFFPCLLSDLLKRRACPSSLDLAMVEKARALAENLEAGYTSIFLPKIHTFSWDTAWRPPSHASIIFTPFPRPAASTAFPAVPEREGIYVMPSGVGRGGEQQTIDVVSALLAETETALALYYPTPPSKTFTEKLGKGAVLTARAIPHEKIWLVVGRAGWGTVWECVHAGKVFVALPQLDGDDPEIALNLKTLRERNLALCWDSARSVWQHVDAVKKTTRVVLPAFAEEFGELDGLKFMAGKILESINQKLIS